MAIDPAWVALSLTRHLGGKTFRAVLDAFDHDLHAILNADEKTLRQVQGIGPKIAQAITQVDVQKTAAAIQAWQQVGVRIIACNNDAYPHVLNRIDDAPPTLFVRGTLPDFTHAYAIIGTRSPSPLSRDIAERLAMTIVKHGGVIVSGLALGVDVHAHRATLAASGLTVGVLGSGVLNIYPQQHRKMAEAVLLRGALICEVAPSAGVSAPQLVARNRIITGLCQGVIVVETAVDGGAMHAARFAKMQGVPVYAVDNAASGNQALLADGAQPISEDFSDFEL